MDTSKLKKFAAFARRTLNEQVSNRLKLVLVENSTARREQPQTVKALENVLTQSGQEQLIERVAYIWFNRFCALRFMDVNRYTRIGIISPAEGQFQPEILASAKMGHIDDDLANAPTREKIFGLLDGKVPSSDPQTEAYRLLLVAVCNDWHKAMPYLFEKINDYTELLMPDDLLSGSSILAYTREALTPEACQDVEVIGWLYQFYISEKKDEVINRRSVVKKEEIPAATQLFTPDWIVKFVVDNSLGRLWLLNRPDSKLAEQMVYYIKPEKPEADYLRITKPEEIKICDPACGSGHMLTYAFDLLYAIYEEEGVDPTEISIKILTHNLYGIDIDERAGELAAFALTMKARSKHRRFFNSGVKPNICVLENVHFDEGELMEVISDQLSVAIGTSQKDILHDLHMFEEADNFGALLHPRLSSEQSAKLLDHLTCQWSLVTSHSFFESMTNQKVLQAIRQVDYLSSKYHVVIANPPYMGGKAMNGQLKSYLKQKFTNFKSDIFAAFIVRNSELCQKGGQLGFVTPFVWMFIHSFKELRNYVLADTTITSLAQLEYNAFAPACIPVAIFTLFNAADPNLKGSYIRLSEFRGSENQGPRTIEAIKNPDCGWFYRTTTSDFKKIPGSPIAYWLHSRFTDLFNACKPLSSFVDGRVGLMTSDNDRFLRYYWEVAKDSICFDADSDKKSIESEKVWFPHNKGGGFRKWAGNYEYVVDWFNRGQRIKETVLQKYPYLNGNPNFVVHDDGFYFKPFVTWSEITSSNLSFRFFSSGFTSNVKGMSAFPLEDVTFEQLLALLNSKFTNYIVKTINPTLSFGINNLYSIPSAFIENASAERLVKPLVALAQSDWDSYETSWKFTNLPLLNPDYRQPALQTTYQKLRAHWREMTLETQRLEDENNFIFIEVYGLQDELTPAVPLNEITLTCNPYYRYGKKVNSDECVDTDLPTISFPHDSELEAKLLYDTMKEFISYVVGCMFGRYALDKPGLILANQGETFEDYLKQIPNPSFPADKDNVIPILDGDWFTDDITERFRKFLRLTFGDEHYAENLKFIEDAIGKDLRKYFLKDFYTDHVKRYKKRPIYWLFCSPKGSFNALIYMHRYQPDTVSIVLNDYLREFKTKLSARLEHLKRIEASADATKAEKTQALKEIENLRKTIEELDSWEREVMYPLATQKIEIDIDNGVKHNYTLFGAALKKIPGLDANED